MIFLGTILGADDLTVPCVPTDVNSIDRVRIQNGVFDSLRISTNVTEPIIGIPPTKWDYDTVLFAEFNDTTKAGNLLLSIDSITHLVVKRKKASDFQWTTLKVKEIPHSSNMTDSEIIAELSLEGVDKTAAIGFEYEYAAVPLVNGIESIYSIAKANCESNGIIICDSEEVWMTTIVDNALDTTANIPNSVVETIWDKYPTVIRNTKANYETIEVTASFVPGIDDCETDWDDEVTTMEYNRAAYDFLRKDTPKVLKATDGRIWLVYVTTGPSDQGDTESGLRKLTFTCTEIGDMESEEDLYNAGLINATEEWWN